LNVLRQQLNENNVPASVAQGVDNKHPNMCFLKDIDQTVTCLKRLVRKNFKKNQVELSMMLNLYHLEYFFQTVTSTRQFTALVLRKIVNKRHRYLLLAMSEYDHRIMRSLKLTIKNCMINTWRKCKQDIDAIFLSCAEEDSCTNYAFQFYSDRVLNFGDFLSPMTSFSLESMSCRETTGNKQRGKRRDSPTSKRVTRCNRIAKPMRLSGPWIV
tara:strand:+ start:38122 stop:38760 length:639 start_codon:yes stop_codon:yes gene_type:complete